jgi:hypothetical protein
MLDPEKDNNSKKFGKYIKSRKQDTMGCYTYRRVAGMNLIFHLSNAEVDGKFQDAKNIVPMSGEI